MSEDVADTASVTTGAIRTRSRVSRGLELLGRPRPTANPSLEPLFTIVRRSAPKADLSVIEAAYELAERAHRGQMRKSGDPYITHPLAVATILAELGMPPDTLAAALLHDVVEDTDHSLAKIERQFGKEIAALVDGVTKLDKVQFGEAAVSETLRKMVIAMAGDIRVLVIKLADRLHNARTWQYVSGDSAARKAAETLEIYAPLAHRLGMNTIKWELEDLSFKYLYPKVYEEIKRQVNDRAGERAEYLATVQRQIEADLAEARVKATVTGRPKHLYSVYQKMMVGQRAFDDIHDLVALRVLVDTSRDCYSALGALHARWKPIAGRFKDYIAMPKFNMYQSLHTTVVGPAGRPVEIQIRTFDMHRQAEFGVAAHWKYKENKGSGRNELAGADSGSLGDLAWLKQVLDWQKETTDPSEFLDSLRYEINTREVYLFTPKGEVITLPAGSTPVDFAYAVHTEVGHHTVGAKVNGRLVPLESVLENGQVVEILTSRAEGAGPSRDWLGFVVSPRARNKIRQWFSKSRREEAIERGKESIAKAMRKQHLPLQRLMSAESLTALAKDLRYADIEAMYAAVGEGQMSARHVVQRLVASLGGEIGVQEDTAEAASPTHTLRQRSDDPGVIVQGMDTSDLWIKLKRCCTPVPGDEIIGFVTRGDGIAVHRSDCTNVAGLQRHPERLLKVAWRPRSGSLFLVQIQVEALDRNHLLADITRVLSDNGVNILGAQVHTSKSRTAYSTFMFEMAEPTHLEHVLNTVRNVPGVFDVTRGGPGAHPHQD